MITFILAALVLVSISSYINYLNSDKILKDQIAAHLLMIAKNKANWVDFYISERKNNLLSIASSEIVRPLFDKKKIADIELKKQEIKKKAEQVARQAEDYIKEHPEMTIKNLQNDAVFQNISVQKVFETGYTALTDFNTLISRFHSKQAIINLDLHSLADELPDFWAIMVKTKGGKTAEGFYEWKEPDGKITQKYTYIAIINAKTAEGVGLSVGATAYLDNFESDMLTFKILENHLKEFKELYNFNDLFLIDTKGNLWWSVEKNLDLETNLETGPLRNSNLAKVFRTAKNNQEVTISDYEIHSSNSKPTAFIAAPVMNSNNLIGVIVVELSTKEIDAILEERTGLGETGETYLVGEDYLMRSNSRFINRSTILKQIVNTKNARACFGNQSNSVIISSEDYREVKIIGTHSKLTEANWCLLAEIDEEEILNTQGKKIVINLAFIAFFLLFISVLSIFFVARNISHPIKKIAIATQKMKEGNYDINLDIKTGDELEDLGVLLNTTSQVLSNFEKKNEQLDNAKTEFLSITSHELRSPMTPMKAQLQMLMANFYGKLNQKQKRAINIVLRNTLRLDRIIVDFLEISRIEAARLKFKFIKSNLKESILGLIEEMNNFMPEKNIKINAKIENLPLIEIDPDRVMQVLRNLIHNAKKFSPDNSVILIKLHKRGNKLVFSIKDEGVGISQLNQKRIFEPFFQAEQTMYNRKGGTGLGLAICRGIVESQNGNIWIDSIPGKGTKFTFTFPLTPVKDIKSIKLLFSAHQDIEIQVKLIFVDTLGPLGNFEFETMANQGLTFELIVDYFFQLKEKKIIEDIEFNDVVSKLEEIFSVKHVSLSKKLKSIFVEILGDSGKKRFNQLKSTRHNDIIKFINRLEKRKIINSKKASRFRDLVMHICVKQQLKRKFKKGGTDEA